LTKKLPPAAPFARKLFGGSNKRMNASTTDQEREREIFLLCLTARTLVHIDERLRDLVTLQQQSADLLRRILSEARIP
jgi:hypothetical protein